MSFKLLELFKYNSPIKQIKLLLELKSVQIIYESYSRKSHSLATNEKRSKVHELKAC